MLVDVGTQHPTTGPLTPVYVGVVAQPLVEAPVGCGAHLLPAHLCSPRTWQQLPQASSHCSLCSVEHIVAAQAGIATIRAPGEAAGTVMPGTIVACMHSLTHSLTQPMARWLAWLQAEKAGAYRYVHSRLITNSEEIAFFSGDQVGVQTTKGLLDGEYVSVTRREPCFHTQVELNGLRRAYNALVKHMNKIYRLRVPYNMLEGVPCQPPLTHIPACT